MNIFKIICNYTKKKLKTKTIINDLQEETSKSLKKILYVKGNFICFYNLDSNVELRGGNTFKYIKTIKLHKEKIFDALLFSENEIILQRDNYIIGYFKLDNKYNVCNYFEKRYSDIENEFIQLKLLKNKKIAYIESDKIYIIGPKIKDSTFNLETKINIEERYISEIFFYEIKSRNQIIFNKEKGFLSLINSNNYKIKPKLFEYNNKNEIFILNDDYFLFRKKANQSYLELRSLITFKCIKTFNLPDDYTCFPLKDVKNIIWIKRDKKIEKYIFDKNKLNIIYKGVYNFKAKKAPERIQGSENLYLVYQEISYFYHIVGIFKL